MVHLNTRYLLSPNEPHHTNPSSVASFEGIIYIPIQHSYGAISVADQSSRLPTISPRSIASATAPSAYEKSNMRVQTREKTGLKAGDTCTEKRGETDRRKRPVGDGS